MKDRKTISRDHDNHEVLDKCIMQNVVHLRLIRSLWGPDRKQVNYILQDGSKLISTILLIFVFCRLEVIQR